MHRNTFAYKNYHKNQLEKIFIEERFINIIYIVYANIDN